MSQDAAVKGKPAAGSQASLEGGTDVTPEELVEFIQRLATNEPHIRCRTGSGPLGRVAQALNEHAALLEARRLSSVEKFGIGALVEQSQNMMMTADTSDRIRFVNFTIPGLTYEQVLGRSVYDFLLPADHERCRAVFHRVLETGVPDSYDVQSYADTGPSWYVVRVGPIRDEGQIVGFTMITTDVTSLKKTQLQLEQSNRELAQSNRELESFASVASHDLQEPLRKIQSFGERLKTVTAGTLAPEAQDYLERMHNAATRMRRLIEDLLAFARVTSKAQPFTRVDLSTIAREVLGDLEVAIEQAKATVTVGELPVIQGDPTQMRQLLQNLLSNALKFRREDAPPRITLEASVEKESGRHEILVQDNGIGFEEKHAEKIFALFQRLHGRGKYEGTGLGLAICRKIAERHGGTIAAHSSPGQGSTFTIRLPQVQAVAQPAQP
ncbi:sensor histidine kinase [Hyalangium minutum]|uniref:histidine kinase n=1 Tax=Hyalangium minutum TaxID=394096 RepID=A0A085WC87_9BACT|nr:ATP-binding protein [Hyalangium minutum]KFE65300.1 Phytochrome, two-component sensor histidine kinase [Hyalangium minutum]